MYNLVGGVGKLTQQLLCDRTNVVCDCHNIVVVIGGWVGLKYINTDPAILAQAISVFNFPTHPLLIPIRLCLLVSLGQAFRLVFSYTTLRSGVPPVSFYFLAGGGVRRGVSN